MKDCQLETYGRIFARLNSQKTGTYKVELKRYELRGAEASSLAETGAICTTVATVRPLPTLALATAMGQYCRVTRESSECKMKFLENGPAAVRARVPL